MTIKTPEFQGTHLWDRLCWAKENLEGKQSDYRIVWEDPDKPEECAKITVPDPNWMACALQGGILPPVEVYWALQEDEAKPGFKKHTRGYLLHNTKPIDKMTEEEDVVYMKALEAGDSSAQSASVTKKKALRDAPAASAISSADTIAKLKAAWDTSVLGDSPYA